MAATRRRPALDSVLDWRPLADVAAQLDVSTATLRTWAPTFGLPVRVLDGATCTAYPFAAALWRCLELERHRRGLGGWSGGSAHDRGVTFRRAWSEWCAAVEVLPDVAALGFQLAAAPAMASPDSAGV